MKTRKRLLASVLCLFMIAMEVAGLAACTAKNDCHHHWGEWSVTTKATCTADGAKERKCAECGDTETAVVQAAGHDWSEATCSAPKTCKTCGATEGEVLGHDYADATCTAPKTCKTCGATEGEVLGHD